MDERATYSSAEQYLERHFRDASDRVLARQVGWTRAEVAAYLARKGLTRSAADFEAIREGRGRLPELRLATGRLEPRSLRAASLLVALATGLAAFAVYLSTTAPGVLDGEDAARILEEREGAGLALLTHPWRLCARLALSLPAGEPAFSVHVAAGLAGAAGAALAFVLPLAAGLRTPAAAGAALALAFSSPLWSAATSGTAAALTPALVLATGLSLLLARRKRARLARCLFLAALLAAAAHVARLPLGSGASLSARAREVAAAFLQVPSIPVSLLAIAGAAVFLRRARRDLWPWLVALLASAIALEGTLAAALLVLPVAFALDAMASRLPRPRIAVWIAAAVAPAWLLSLGWAACDRRSETAAQEYGECLLAALPSGARVHAAAPHLVPLVRYFLEARPGGAPGAAFEAALEPAWQARQDAQRFAAGHDQRSFGSGYCRVPHGPLWRLTTSRPKRGEACPGPWSRSGLAAGGPAELSRGVSSSGRRYVHEIAFLRAAGRCEPFGEWVRAARELSPDALAVLALASEVEALEPSSPLVDETYEAARAADPGLAEPLRALARRALAAKDLARARVLVEEGRRLRPRAVEEALLLGQVAEAEGKLDDAKAAYEDAARLDPRDHRPSRQLGLLHHRRGEVDEAVEQLKKSLALFPHQPEARAVLSALAPDAVPPDPLAPGSLVPRPPSVLDPFLPRVPGLEGLEAPGQPRAPGLPGPPVPRGAPGTFPLRPGAPGVPGIPRPGGPPQPGGARPDR
ncbi:MAG: hypothetical protein HY721_31755 [Planctomycetes bacterium]|nr:hypothetical protein [Planctomycetota bacterium]